MWAIFLISPFKKKTKIVTMLIIIAIDKRYAFI